ncbi:MAG TPA: cardiolipin synthase [Candidatus Binatia bacterium]
MSHIFTILATLLFLYALVTGVFLLMENRRPQSTLAWMLVLWFAPGVGLLIYLFFGRDSKAFSKRRKLLMQDLEANSRPLLSPILSRQDAQLAQLETESVSRRKLASLVQRNSFSVLTMRNRVEIQQDGAKFYPSLIEDIKAAQRSIHLQYFIWAVDPFTNRLKQILIEKAGAGIEVRLLYDPIGSQAHVGRRYVRNMLAAGIRMAPTAPPYQLHTISYRNHRKITVIDGAIGYTGGMNIGQEQLDGGEGFDYWRDTQVRVVGESAAVLQAVFMVDWYNAVRENLFYAKYFPDDATDRAEGDVPVQILTSGPDSQWAAIRQLYAFMIVSAQRHVYIQSPFFIPDATLAEALRTAALSGITIKVMVSARPSGNRLPDWAGNTYIEEIVSAGVRVFLYEKGYLHAKTISIDSEICSIGSANIDIRSFSINYELNAVFYSERIAKELESDFERDLEYCSEFDPAAYQKRGIVIRFRDSLARLLSPLL